MCTYTIIVYALYTVHYTLYTVHCTMYVRTAGCTFVFSVYVKSLCKKMKCILHRAGLTMLHMFQWNQVACTHKLGVYFEIYKIYKIKLLYKAVV